MEAVVFVVCAVIVLGGALGVVLSRNPVHSALSLVATLFGIAVLFLDQDAQLLAAVQVIVYAGAIVVLFLFVLMLLGVDTRRGPRHRAARRPADPRRHRRPGAARRRLLAVILIGGERRRHRRPARPPQALVRRPVATSRQLGRQLFTNYSSPSRSPPGCSPSRWSARSCWPGAPTDLQPHPRSPSRIDDERATSRSTRPSVEERAADGGSLDLAYLVARRRAVHASAPSGLLVRRNPLVMFMCVELMLNAVNLTFVTFGAMLNDIGGQVIVFFVLVVAAAEVVVGLGIIVAVMRRRTRAPPPTTSRC